MDVRRTLRSPLLARWLLRGLVPRTQREFALGDLEEQFQQLVDSHVGRRGARAWYWRQVWKCFNERTVSPQTGYAPPRRKGAGMMETFWQDVRYALRTLRQKPMFAAVVVLTLALGIGANTAIFTVVNAVLLRPLHYADPDRLMYVLEDNLKKGWTAFTVSPPNFVDWRAQARSFESLAAVNSNSYNYSGGEQPERLAGRQVSEGFFAMLGVQPQLGRWFDEAEYQMGRDRVVLLTHSAWQRLFAGDPGVLNRAMLLNGESYTVVGVLPPEFRMYQADLWTPRVFNAGELGRRGSHFLTVMGRLKPGVSVEQARQEMSALAERLAAEYPDTNRDWGAVVTPMHDWIVGDVRPALLLLTGAVALVLLIACA
ncbi:MAG TPA: ABC transporter permease, partial [Candidatus Acidoferrales bacterium]